MTMQPAGDHPPTPGDVPALRPPWLDDLGLLVGEWETHARRQDRKSVV